MCQCWIALRCLSLQVTQNARSQAVLTNYSGFDYICSDSAAHKRSNKTFLSSLISPHCFVWGRLAWSSRHWGKAGCQTHSPMFPPIMSGWREVFPWCCQPHARCVQHSWLKVQGSQIHLFKTCRKLLLLPKAETLHQRTCHSFFPQEI